VWSLSSGPSGSESSLVSQFYNPSLVDIVIMSMQYSANTTHVLGSYVYLDHVVLHPIQPAVMLMQSFVGTNPIFGE
jgi:hypothetical protein